MGLFLSEDRVREMIDAAIKSKVTVVAVVPPEVVQLAAELRALEPELLAMRRGEFPYDHPLEVRLRKIEHCLDKLTALNRDTRHWRYQ